MDPSWRTIDVSDIVWEQTLLRDAILDAVEDGTVDGKEMQNIINMMKRALGDGKHGKRMTKKVVEALGDGDLSQDDMDLLLALCPPEPREDWEQILECLERDFGYLKTVFRYYSLQGAADGDVDSCGKGQFSAYAREIQVLDKKSTDLNAGQIDRIFIRANQDRAGGVDFFARENQGAALKKLVGATGSEPVDNEMQLKEFVCGNLRLAHAKYRQMPSLADRWEKFMEDNVRQFADFGELEDDVTRFLEAEAGRRWQADTNDDVEQVFAAFCVGEGDDDIDAGLTAQTMDITEFCQFLHEAQLLGDKLTVREARAIFVQVNLDDDLFVQEDADQGNDSSQLVLDEFVECLVRNLLLLVT
jgi:hypothetical protein